jgi:phosphatidate cytidylyltransferase
VADDEGQERRSEDLFEDLDKFFAPIQDVDWPEEGAPPAKAKPEEPAAREEPAPPEEPSAAAGGSDDVIDEPIPWEEPAGAAAAAAETPAPAAETRTPADESRGAPVDAPEPDAGGFRSSVQAEPPAPSPVAPAGVEPDASGSTLAEDMFGPSAAGESGEPGAPTSTGDMFGADSGGDADDLLPTGWATGLDEGIDLDVDVPAVETPAAERFVGEPTAEMSGEDWAELQAGAGADHPVGEEAEPFSYMERFLPDDENTSVPEFGYGPDPGTGAAPTGGTTGIDWDESAGATGLDWDEPIAAGPTSVGDSGPISIDDLRRAPDEYRDLPGPDEHSGAGLGLAAAAAGEHEPGPFDGTGEEPQAGDVEAAAEHFAESIREEDPALGMAAADPFAVDPLGDEGADVDLFGEPVHREPYSDRPEPMVFPDEGGEEPDDLLSFGESEGPRTVKVSAAEGTGPSWQEPTSVEVPVEGEQEPPRPSRNLSAAIVTGVVLAVVALLALLAGKVFFAFVAGAVVLLAQLELYTAIRKRGYQPAVPLGLAIGALIAIGGYNKGEGGILAMTLLGVLFTPLWYMATPARQRRNVVANMGMTFVGILAVPFLGGFAMAIIHDTSRAFTIMVLALAFGFDIVAYAIGTLTGSKPLAPTISPNKTREGVYGGILVLAVLGFVVLGNIEPLTSVWQGLLVGVAAAVAATFGDLAESLAKRDLGVKDMGTIFPGHGGALDRIDSVLFVAPVVFYLVKILLS